MSRRLCFGVAVGACLVACGGATETAPVATAEPEEAEDPNLALVHDFVRAWKAGDDEALGALAPPDGLWVWLEDGTFATPSILVSAAGCAEPDTAPVPCASHPRAARIDQGVRALEGALDNAHQDEPVPRYPEDEHPTRPPWATVNAEAQRFIDYLGYLGGGSQLSAVEATLDDADSELFAIDGSDEVHVVMGRHDGAPCILHILVMQSEAG